MSRFNLSRLFISTLLFGCFATFGQAARSPFSAFGYGDYVGDALVHNQGMAGVGVSNPQFWYFNNINPALAAYNRLAVFQAGLLGENKRISNATTAGDSRNGNLNYLLLGFPAWRDKTTGILNWGMGVGLMPYSNVNYNYQYLDSIGGVDVYYSDKASGGFNQFYWSNGFRIAKNLTVGLKTAMLFSSIISDYSNRIDDPNQGIYFVPNVHEIQRVRGARFTPGVSYRIDSIANKYSLNFGATWELRSKLNSEADQVLERRNATGTILQSDTLNNIPGIIEFPDRITAGVSFGQLDKWIVAIDYSHTSFGSASVKQGLDQVSVQNGSKIAAGVEVTPDARSLGSYFKRMTYRAGFSNEEGTYLVNGNGVKDFGINFGFSFPVNRISSLDIAFRTGKRGDKVLNGIEENYFKIYFGVTFNDQQWFIKRKFD